MTALAATAARAAFAGDELVVQSKNSLNVWSPTTGKQRGRSLSIPVGSVLADADGALAVVLLKDRRVLVVDLLSGRRRTMRPPGYGRVLADIEPGGLYVATQSKTAREGRLQFIPRSSLTP